MARSPWQVIKMLAQPVLETTQFPGKIFVDWWQQHKRPMEYFQDNLQRGEHLRGQVFLVVRENEFAISPVAPWWQHERYPMVMFQDEWSKGNWRRGQTFYSPDEDVFTATDTGRKMLLVI